MRTVKTLKPGQKGTKKPLTRFGASLGNAKRSALDRGRPAPGPGALQPGVWHCGSIGGRGTCSGG